jgi:uncharacterized protein YcgI (DUF1989 family)
VSVPVASERDPADAQLRAELPAGEGWIGELAAGAVLRIVDLLGNQAVDTLVLISNCPQLNNPCNGYDPTPVRLVMWAAP